WSERLALGGVELDQSPDRHRARLDQRELRAEPVLGDGGVRVGACDQPTLGPDLLETCAGDVHAKAPCAADALGMRERNRVDRRLAGPRDLLDDLQGAIATAVEDHDHLVAGAWHL